MQAPVLLKWCLWGLLLLATILWAETEPTSTTSLVLQQAQTIAELQEITTSPNSIFLVRQIRKQIQRDSKTWGDGILGLRQKEGQSSQPNALSYLSDQS